MRLTNGDGAVHAAAFAAAMDGFAPFEPAPVVAVGVSGGPDSMALALLLDGWARQRGGSVLALTVDHRLREDSTAEAGQVASWLGARNISHAVLAWTGDKPVSGVQNAAREARYRLLAAACAERSILHLATAHHAGDQAETVLFRQQGDSGPDGLAGMPAQRSLGAVRLVRPLLGWSKVALTATCAAFGQAFIDDPSNRAERYVRTALRRSLSGDADAERRLVREAIAAGKARAWREQRLARLLGRIAEVRPDGTIRLDRTGLAATPPELRQAVLAAALRTVGGADYAPDGDSLARLDRTIALTVFRGSGLGRCLIRAQREFILICREPDRIAPALDLQPGEWRLWDRRFRLRTEASGLQVGAFGRPGYAALRREIGAKLPAIVGAGLPVMLRNGKVIAVPSLGWGAPDAPPVEQQFAPHWPLASETFTVVCDAPDII